MLKLYLHSIFLTIIPKQFFHFSEIQQFSTLDSSRFNLFQNKTTLPLIYILVHWLAAIEYEKDSRPTKLVEWIHPKRYLCKAVNVIKNQNIAIRHLNWMRPTRDNQHAHCLQREQKTSRSQLYFASISTRILCSMLAYHIALEYDLNGCCWAFFGSTLFHVCFFFSAGIKTTSFWWHLIHRLLRFYLLFRCTR